MEMIYNAKDYMASLDAKELIDTLKDSFIFLGSANVDMMKVRRESMRRNLPRNMQGLCGDSVEFSSSHLFGDNLNSSIKDISELNKISSSLKQRGSSNNRSNFRRGNFRERGRAFRGSATRSSKRYAPYTKNEARRPLNEQGPSRK